MNQFVMATMYICHNRNKRRYHDVSINDRCDVSLDMQTSEPRQKKICLMTICELRMLRPSSVSDRCMRIQLFKVTQPICFHGKIICPTNMCMSLSIQGEENEPGPRSCVPDASFSAHDSLCLHPISLFFRWLIKGSKYLPLFLYIFFLFLSFFFSQCATI